MFLRSGRKVISFSVEIGRESGVVGVCFGVSNYSGSEGN